MQLLTYMVSMSLFHNHRNRLCQPCLQVHVFRVCTSLLSIAMTMAFGLGMILHVRRLTTLENDVLRNRQLSGSAVNSFFDKGKFEAMKTLSGCEAERYAEHQFHAKTEYISRYWVIDVWQVVWTRKEKMTKMALRYCTLLCLTVFCKADGWLYGSWEYRNLQRRRLGV